MSDGDIGIDDLSDASTLCTRVPSLDLNHVIDEGVRETSRERELLQAPRSRRRVGSESPPKFPTPAAYLAKTIQGEIDDNLRDYPSLDHATQTAISSAYRYLHQQVKDGGYYACRYSEYGKEIVRYLFIFALFCTALHAGWYCTSAALLGLFWVSMTLLFPSTGWF